MLEELLTGVIRTRDALAPANVVSRKPKVVLKISPDLDEAQLVDIADVINASGIDGVIISNTTTQRPSTLTDCKFGGGALPLFRPLAKCSAANKTATGGLSGVPLKTYSLATLRTLRAHLPASIPLIGCGGISSGADALEFAKAGASLVQVYTAFGYDGVGTCRRIKDQLVEALEEEGTTWWEVVEKSAQNVVQEPERDPAVIPGEEKGSVRQLVSEALELRTLLDKLGTEMGCEAELDGESTITLPTS